jgi:excisionase family DNA binding protein
VTIQDHRRNSTVEMHTALLNAQQAAAYLNLSQSFIRKSVAANRIPFIRIGTRTLFRPCDLDAWIGERFVPTHEQVQARAERLAATTLLATKRASA